MFLTVFSQNWYRFETQFANSVFFKYILEKQIHTNLRPEVANHLYTTYKTTTCSSLQTGLVSEAAGRDVAGAMKYSTGKI